MEADVAGGMEREALAGYHLYKLARPVALAAGDEKQLPLFEERKVPVRKEYLVQGGQLYATARLAGEPQTLPVRMVVHFENSEANQLGMPLPEGKVRLFDRDEAGHLQFVGEQRMAAVASDERVRLEMGRAFDLVAERKQLDYRRLTSKMHESEWEVALRNRSDKSATMTVNEQLYGNWEIVEASHKYEKVDANTIRFHLPLPKGEEVRITYKVRVGV